MNNETSNNVPSDKDIAALEAKLSEMKRVREESKRAIVNAMKSDEILGSLGKDELVSLMRRIQSRLSGQHRKVRGSRVSEDLKASLVKVLTKPNPPTLSQISAMFNLSVSYISRVKADIRKSGPVMNAYEDHQLNFPARSEHPVAS